MTGLFVDSRHASKVRLLPLHAHIIVGNSPPDHLIPFYVPLS